MDANQEWDMREITGKEDIDGVLHYLVEWCPTLVPKDSMGYGQELVAEFEARQARMSQGQESAKGTTVYEGGQARIK